MGSQTISILERKESKIASWQEGEVTATRHRGSGEGWGGESPFSTTGSYRGPTISKEGGGGTNKQCKPQVEKGSQ